MLPNVGTRLDVKRLDKIYNSETRAWVLTDSASAPVLSDDAYVEYAFTIIRTFAKESNSSTPTITTTIQINSPLLKSVGQEIIGQLEGVSWNAKYLVVDLQILLAFLPRLSEHLSSLTPEEPTYVHLEFLIQNLTADNSLVLKTIRSLIDEQEITYDLLWAILLPHTNMFMRCLITSEPRCVHLSKAQIETSSEWRSRWRLNCEFVDADKATSNTQYGLAKIIPLIYYFDGTKKIYDLPIFPMDHMKPVETFKKRLINRGKKWEEMNDICHQYYHGTAFRYQDGEFVGVSVNGRIMVDRKNFSTAVNGCAPKVRSFVKALDDDLRRLLATPVVYGFSLSDKLWLAFNVSKVEEVRWDDEAVANLILPQEQRDLIHSLVATHMTPTPSFDDFVQGKGLGLVFNLHGPAGVGKTLTVEATSARLKRPLYVVGAGDLGTNAGELDKRLTQILKISHSWQALVLIDEADVFLEERSFHELERNAMVAVFLRHLEYFRGVLFLTTNRVDIFDEAFQSRIHVSLRYHDLTPEAKSRIWMAFLHKADKASDEWLTHDHLQELGEKELNGRQIKNVVKIAESLAKSRVERIGYAHVTQALDMIHRFDARLGASSKTAWLDLVLKSFGFGKGLWVACVVLILALFFAQHGTVTIIIANTE